MLRLLFFFGLWCNYSMLPWLLSFTVPIGLDGLDHVIRVYLLLSCRGRRPSTTAAEALKYTCMIGRGSVEIKIRLL